MIRINLRARVSYCLCYHDSMATRDKRSISLPAELSSAIQRAAEDEKTTFSGWLAATASRRLRLEEGSRGLAEWEQENGPLTEEELAEGLARARALLARPSRRSAQKATP